MTADGHRSGCDGGHGSPLQLRAELGDRGLPYRSRFCYIHSMLPEHRSFVIRGEDGQEYGPVDLKELRDWVQENRAGIGTEVRRDEPSAAWHPWQTYPELVALLAEVQVTSPVPEQAAVVLAPYLRRIVAFALDIFLAALLAYPLVYLLSMETGIPDLEERFLLAALHPELQQPQDVMTYGMIGNLISNGMLLLYFTGFLAAHGQTPAKAIFRLRVVDANGSKPTLLKSLFRALVLLLSMSLLCLPLTYVFFNPQRRALHDIIAGTWVVEA
jgi:uncharacterized RDD family membrane protein YckC